MSDINPELGARTITNAPKTSQVKNLLYAFGALLLLGITLAWLFTRQDGPANSEADARASSPLPGAATVAFDASALEARLDDAQQINRVLREQALALSQRMDLLEDTVAGLRRGAAPNAENFKLDEAQYLLSLAETRLDLFGDPASAIRALELADNLLAGISDPALANVRQTLSIELDVVRAAPMNDVPALSGRLRALIQELPNLAILTEAPNATRSRLWLALDRYLVVRREGEAMPVLGRSPWAVREGLTLEFERAQLALERQQAQSWQNALETAVAMAERGLKPDDTSVESFLARLRALAKTALAPEPPKLGATLRTLRRLREGPLRPVTPDADSAELEIATPEVLAPETGASNALGASEEYSGDIPGEPTASASVEAVPVETAPAEALPVEPAPSESAIPPQ
jgi:uroporphyrin-3 C-methyltransferase